MRSLALTLVFSGLAVAAEPAGSSGGWTAAWTEAEAKAKGLAAEMRFGDAMAQYSALADRFGDAALRERVSKAVGALAEQAGAAFTERTTRAQQLVKEGKFDEARRALQPIVERFGLYAQVRQAERLLAEIEAAEKAAKIAPPKEPAPSPAPATGPTLAEKALKLFPQVRVQEVKALVEGLNAQPPTLRVVLDAEKSRVAYTVKVEDKTFVVVDGQEHPLYDAIGETLVFSADGRRVGYMAKLGNQWTPVLDGKQGELYHVTLWGTPVFSPDGRHVLYGAKRGESLPWCVFLDGEEVPNCQHTTFHAGSARFSPDGTRWAYAADGQVFVNGRAAGKSYLSIAQGDLAFSPDSKRLAYGARVGSDTPGRKGRWTLVVDGKEGPCFDDLGLHSVYFSPDSSRVAFLGLNYVALHDLAILSPSAMR